MLGYDFIEGTKILGTYMDESTLVYVDDTTFVFEVLWADLTSEDYEKLDALGFIEIMTDAGCMVGLHS